MLKSIFYSVALNLFGPSLITMILCTKYLIIWSALSTIQDSLFNNNNELLTARSEYERFGRNIMAVRPDLRPLLKPTKPLI